MAFCLLPSDSRHGACQAQRQHNRHQSRILAGHRAASEQSRQQEQPIRRRASPFGTRSLHRQQQREQRQKQIARQRPFDVRDDCQTVRPRRREINHCCQPTGGPPEKPPSRAEQRQRRQRSEPHQHHLSRQCAPIPVLTQYHAKQTQHLRQERKVRVNVVLQERDLAVEEILLRSGEVIRLHVKVGRRQHRTQQHRQQKQTDGKDSETLRDERIRKLLPA